MKVKFKMKNGWPCTKVGEFEIYEGPMGHFTNRIAKEGDVVIWFSVSWPEVDVMEQTMFVGNRSTMKLEKHDITHGFPLLTCGPYLEEIQGFKRAWHQFRNFKSSQPWPTKPTRGVA